MAGRVREASSPEADPSRVAEALSAYARGLATREDAIEALGLRDHAELLVALGDAGLTPPRPCAEEILAQALVFERIWRAT